MSLLDESLLKKLPTTGPLHHKDGDVLGTVAEVPDVIVAETGGPFATPSPEVAALIAHAVNALPVYVEAVRRLERALRGCVSYTDDPVAEGYAEEAIDWLRERNLLSNDYQSEPE